MSWLNGAAYAAYYQTNLKCVYSAEVLHHESCCLH
jgi:hypothetical protein